VQGRIFSICAWVKPTVTPTWSRIFDFGIGIVAYFLLTTNSGRGLPRFALTTSGNAIEQHEFSRRRRSPATEILTSRH
jgi:hypothetical protein